MIGDHLGDGSPWGVDIRYSHEEELLCTAGAVRQMSSFFDEVFEDYLVNGGIYALDPSVLELIPAKGYTDFSRHLFPELLSRGRRFYGHRLRGQLLSTDTPVRYEDTCRQVAAGVFDLP